MAASPVRLCEVSTGQVIRQLSGYGGAGSSVAFSPDGKRLVSAGEDGIVRFLDPATGKEICGLQAQQGWLSSVAFSPDGKTLATAGTDATVLVWLLAEVIKKEGVQPKKLDAKQLDDLWTALASKDAPKAYQAVETLIHGGKDAVPFLQQRLQPPPAADAQQVARLLADLDNDQFAVREKASQELEKLGESARPAFKKALTGKPSAEVQRRVQTLLDKLSAEIPPPDQVHVQRAVMVLEQIGTPEAVEALEKLSKGAEGALLTVEAKAACRRMKP